MLDKTNPARYRIITRYINNWVRMVLMRCPEINGIYSNNAVGSNNNENATTAQRQNGCYV
jgi:hypothetical protein